MVWIQVGHFFETYGDVAIELAKTLEMTLGERNGVPKVGFPATHTRRWLDRTVAAGYSVGLAYQEQNGQFRLERNLGISSKVEPDPKWNKKPDESFMKTGSNIALGLRANGPLQPNQVFKIPTDRPGQKWRKVCKESECAHDSDFVECILDDAQGRQYLGMTSAQGLVIYPQAW